jgi:hypothetical protein
MLMKLSVEEKQYQDAYYYTEFLNNYKCTWEGLRKHRRPARQMSKKNKKVTPLSTLVLEHKKDLKWYRYVNDWITNLQTSMRRTKRSDYWRYWS